MAVELNQSSFQAIADSIVEDVASLADLLGVKVELYFCLQLVPGPDPQEELAYHIGNGEHSAFFATDSSGRMWFCDCSRNLAVELTSDTNYAAISDELMESLGCPAIGRDRTSLN